MLCAKFLISSFQEGLGIYSLVHCVQADCALCSAEPQKCLQSGALHGYCSIQVLPVSACPMHICWPLLADMLTRIMTGVL